MISSKFFHSLAITETQRIFQWGISPQTLRMKMYILRRFRSAAKEAINNAPACVEKMPENRELGVEHQMPLQVEHLVIFSDLLKIGKDGTKSIQKIITKMYFDSNQIFLVFFEIMNFFFSISEE